MAISVGVANPGTISGVVTATPPRITGTSVATPGTLGPTVNNYGTQTSYSPNFIPLKVGTSGSRTASPSLLQEFGGGGGGGAPAPVYAPKLDVAAVNAQARAAAENAVNPYYTKVLNEFLTQQAAQRARAQTQYQTDITDIEDTLKETVEGNALTKARTEEDVTKNIADIADSADEFQTDSGEEFDAARMMEARDTAASGKTGGLALQASEKGVEKRNKVEERQAKKFKDLKETQQLFKGRTMADLLKSDELATKRTEKGKTQRKFDLDSYIESQDFETSNKRNELERSRLNDITQNQSSQSKLLFNNYLAGIADPAKYEAAVRTYGGLF